MSEVAFYLSTPSTPKLSEYLKEELLIVAPFLKFPEKGSGRSSLSLHVFNLNTIYSVVLLGRDQQLLLHSIMRVSSPKKAAKTIAAKLKATWLQSAPRPKNIVLDL